MSDTIAAIATARAPSAIGILRLTGTDTVQILDKVFRPKGRSMSLRPDRVMVLGDVLDRTGQVVDNGLAVLFRSPNSYTGEDCAEIHCHGSPVVLQEVLLSLFAAGARQAKGGEFTQRAFLNGRMDLMQAGSHSGRVRSRSHRRGNGGGGSSCRGSALRRPQPRRGGDLRRIDGHYLSLLCRGGLSRRGY